MIITSTMRSFSFFQATAAKKFLKSAMSVLSSPSSIRRSPKEGLCMYKNAINDLNQLQSNASVIREIIKTNDKYASHNLSSISQLLHLLGISMSEVDALNIVHISGTKGKTSTSFYTEAILRNYGFKTGLFTSPHILSLRERIRINSLPISQESFAENFTKIYPTIKKAHQEGLIEFMPTYFQFLTLLAFYTFLAEKVNAVVLEVGIGGEYDTTNFIAKPVACGITFIGYDHTNILGESLGEIAWHKAGIMKADAPCFTMHQEEEALSMIKERAEKKGITLYNLSRDIPKLREGSSSLVGFTTFPQQRNFLLAFFLSHYFLHKVSRLDSKFTLMNETSLLDVTNCICAAKSCNLIGRYQVYSSNKNITFCLDGAHEVSSVAFSLNWFKDICIQKQQTLLNKSEEMKTVLVFNCSNHRSYEQLLKPLMSFKFDKVIFCTNEFYSFDILDNENVNLIFNAEKQRKKCLEIYKFWLSECQDATNPAQVFYFDSILEALKYIHNLPSDYDSKHVNIYTYVTGSLYLVSAFLRGLNFQG